jgi:amino acid transporter
MGLPTLTGLVVGSMVGAGVFSLPARFGVATGILGSLIAWAVAGTGMLMLAFVFQTLAIRKPDLDSGVFIYAKAGFGDYSASTLRSASGPVRSPATPSTGCSSAPPSARSSPPSATATPSSPWRWAPSASGSSTT